MAVSLLAATSQPMYAPFFGLQHPPFSIAPDPRYLFMSERHRDALAHLLYGLDAGGGFVLLTGEVGTGKTTVCRCFLEQIPSTCNVAYIFNPKLTVGELLRSICDEFGVPHRPAVPGAAETVQDCIDPLNASLLAAHASGRNNVLIIDEAQNLAPDVLEQLRLLTNLETSERKLLQIILIGQPELRDMVAQPSMEQLAQRVIARFHLGALTPDETQQYIAHRLAVAGLRGPLPFERGALRRVHALSHGVPRRINLLCDRALLGAYALGARQVTRAIVNRAAREVFGAPQSAGAASWFRRQPAGSRSRSRWLPVGAGALAGAAAVATAGWALGVWPPSAPPRPAPVAGEGSRAAAAAAGPASMAGPAAAATAFAPAPAASAPPAKSALAQFVEAQPAGDRAAWQALAGAWGAVLPADTADAACAALPTEALRCYRNRRASLALLRQIDRPVLLALHAPGGPADAGAGAANPSGAEAAPGAEAPPAVQVLLRSLQGDTATLEGAGGGRVEVPVAALAQAWRGEITTLWRTPVGMPERGNVADTPAGAAWLDRQLARALPDAGSRTKTASAHRTTPAQRQARIHRFQMAQGLVPDGRAGPLTLMLLNRAAGVDEPRLRPAG